MNEKDHKLISLNIILRFWDNIEEDKELKLKRWVTRKAIESKYHLWKYLSSWRCNAFKTRAQAPTHNTKANNISHHIITDYNSSFYKPCDYKYHYQTTSTNNKSGITDNYPSRWETSWDKKEREEYERCTFKPVTNNSKKRSMNTSYNNRNSNDNKMNTSVYERWYQDSEKYETKRQWKAMEIDINLSKTIPFAPLINKSPCKYTKKVNSSFNERLGTYHDNKATNYKKITSYIDDKYNKECSFSPKLLSKSPLKEWNQNEKEPAYKRLYNKSKERQSRRIQTEAESNRAATSPNKSGSGNTTIDYKRIEEWYNAYHGKNMKINKIRDEMEKESGSTFTPFIYKENRYYNKINSTVLERTDKSISDKKNYIAKTVENDEKVRKENQIGGLKQLSKVEKEKIAKKIIERWYLGEETTNSMMNERYLTATNFQDQHQSGNSEMLSTFIAS